MITKEKLLNGYIKNDQDELRQKFVEAAEFHGFDLEWMEGDIRYLTGECVFIDEQGTVEGGFSHLLPPQEELTLEDFTEAPKKDTGGVSKWDYDPIDMEECLFGLKHKYTNGELYILYEGEYLKVSNQTQLAEGFITNTLYTREEIKWQGEVTKHLNLRIYDVSAYPLGTWTVHDVINDCPEKFLEAARIALRSTGELR